jgi:DNA-binding CsgD family transcriptional regulator
MALSKNESDWVRRHPFMAPPSIAARYEQSVAEAMYARAEGDGHLRQRQLGFTASEWRANSGDRLQSARQKRLPDVARLHREGKTSAEIGRELGISQDVAKRDVRSLGLTPNLHGPNVRHWNAAKVQERQRRIHYVMNNPDLTSKQIMAIFECGISSANSYIRDAEKARASQMRIAAE